MLVESVAEFDDEVLHKYLEGQDPTVEELKSLIATHAEKTGSPRANALLAEWQHASRKFVRVIAKERAALEAAEEKHEAASIPAATK